MIAEGADCPKSQLVVPPDSTIVQRRDAILDLLAGGGRTPKSGAQYSPADFAAAQHDEVVLASQATPHWIAPHFVWAVRDELTQKLCGDAPSCEQLDAGGLRVITTLDVKLQKIAEKWVRAAVTVPHTKDPTAAAKALGFEKLEPWMANLRSKTLRNGALVAIDYQTGELVAYVGSANYYATSNRPEFQPQYDVAGKGFRQPGSAFKPFNYVTGIDDHALTAATMLMDVSTDFGGGYTPNDADLLERGPVRVRNALQFSLNIPSVKAMAINRPDHVFAKARDFGMTFQTDRTQAGLALALGVQEVRPVDLVTAYGTLANGGLAIGHTTILNIQDTAGKDVLPPYQPPVGTQVVSPQAAFIVTDILAGNTNPKINPFWGKFAIDGPDRRRPATLKTGTNNDAKDLNAYGYIAPPTEAGPDRRRLRPGRRGVERQLGQQPGVDGQGAALLDRRLHLRLAGLHAGGERQLAGRGLRATGRRLDPGRHRPLDRDVAGRRRSVGQGVVHQRHGTAERSRGRCVRRRGPGPGGIRRAIQQLAGSRPGLAAPGRDRRGTAGGPDRSRTSYFYNGRFQPYGAPGVRCSGARAAPLRAPRRAASRCRRPTQTA